MGAGITSLFEDVVPPEGFIKSQRGTTLRKLFGAYTNVDIWAVYRRFRVIDDGDGWLSYDEISQVLSLSEFNLLFVFEIFSQQNELVDSREMLAVVCVFSSAKLEEKGKFLLTLFDASKTGTCTGSEIALLCCQVLHVLAKCTNSLVKVKQVNSHLQDELADLVPEYQEAAERNSEEAFQSERVIGHIELEKLLATFREAYEMLPVAGGPPAGASPPPPPDWGTGSMPEKKGGAGGAAGTTRNGSSNGGPRAFENAAKKQEKELPYLSWQNGMNEEGGGTLLPAPTRPSSDGAAPAEKGSKECLRGFMVVHGADFAVVAKDLTSFRRSFIRGVSAALGLPVGCVEVVNVTRGSVVVEFVLHAAGRGGDTRDPAMLREILEQQLTSKHSALRRGQFGQYAETAELMAGEPERVSAPPTPANQDDRKRDQAIQTDPASGTSASMADLMVPSLAGSTAAFAAPARSTSDTAQQFGEAERMVEAARERSAKLAEAHRVALEDERDLERMLEGLRAAAAGGPGAEGRPQAAPNLLQ